jgi:hypothetical protein
MRKASRTAFGEQRISRKCAVISCGEEVISIRERVKTSPDAPQEVPTQRILIKEPGEVIFVAMVAYGETLLAMNCRPFKVRASFIEIRARPIQIKVSPMKVKERGITIPRSLMTIKAPRIVIQEWLQEIRATTISSTERMLSIPERTISIPGTTISIPGTTISIPGTTSSNRAPRISTKAKVITIKEKELSILRSPLVITEHFTSITLSPLDCKPSPLEENAIPTRVKRKSAAFRPPVIAPLLRLLDLAHPTQEPAVCGPGLRRLGVDSGRRPESGDPSLRKPGPQTAGDVPPLS